MSIRSPRSVRSSAFASVVALAVTGLTACEQGMPYDDPVDNGRWLARKDCASCHSVQDTSMGPSLLNLQGTEVTLDDGTTRLRDRAYFEQAITDPWSEVREGWGKTMLPLRYEPEELAALVAWLESGASPE